MLDKSSNIGYDFWKLVLSVTLLTLNTEVLVFQASQHLSIYTQSVVQEPTLCNLLNELEFSPVAIDIDAPGCLQFLLVITKTEVVIILREGLHSNADGHGLKKVVASPWFIRFQRVLVCPPLSYPSTMQPTENGVMKRLGCPGDRQFSFVLILVNRIAWSTF